MRISSTELLALDIQLAFSTHVQHTSALCLSNLFLERSAKHQAHYFSRLETRKTQLASCETRLETRFSKFSRIESRVEFHHSRVTVNLPLSGTVYTVVKNESNFDSFLNTVYTRYITQFEVASCYLPIRREIYNCIRRQIKFPLLLPLFSFSLFHHH